MEVMPKTHPAAFYRPDIDGLRAMAVLLVLVYHLNPDSIPAGFVGVSVFFVISGFLITQIIQGQLNAGSFSFRQFFEKRARRIIPALWAVLGVSLLFGILILTPEDLVALAKAEWASLLFVSNMYFWQDTDYFSRHLAGRPILHTWSLGVEMQFYLLWPVLLWAGHRYIKKFYVPLAIGALALTSYIAAQWLMPTDGNAVFFLLPFRVFELGIGALLAYMPTKKLAGADIIFLPGLFIILVVSIIGQPPMLDAWRYHLLPCLGAAMVIYSGNHARSRVLLTNPAMVWMGRISYSLYLIHWPLIAYYKYLGFSVQLPQAIGLALVAIAFSAISYRIIETPFRRIPKDPRTSYKHLLALAMSTIVLAGLALMVQLQDGMKWRLNAEQAAKAPTFQNFGIGDFSYLTVNTLGNSAAEPSFIIVGDSYAAQYFYGLDILLKRHGKSALAYSIPACSFAKGFTVRDQGDIIKDCDKAYDKVMELTHGNSLPVVVSFRWPFYIDNLLDHHLKPHRLNTYDNLEQFMVEQLEALRKRFGDERPMLIIGISPDLMPNPILARCFTMPHVFLNDCEGETRIPRHEYAMYDRLNKRISQFQMAHPNTQWIDPMDLYCDAANCVLMESDTRLFFDTWHLSRDGSLRAVEHFAPVFLSLQPLPNATP